MLTEKSSLPEIKWNGRREPDKFEFMALLCVCHDYITAIKQIPFLVITIVVFNAFILISSALINRVKIMHGLATTFAAM
ncbi:MAG: hypothetical protein ABIA63_12805 [bacterium]